MEAGAVFGLGLFGLIVIVFIIILYWSLAEMMGDVAESKGHDRNSYRNWCFFLGIFGYLLVIGLKDLNVKKQNDRIIELLESNNMLDSNSETSEVTGKDLPML